MTFGEKILSLRKSHNWSQEELADRVGVTRQAVSRWESGSAKPDADKIIALCDLFEISADYLLRDRETIAPEEPAVSAESKKKSPWNVASWCAAGFSAVTFFLLKLLSSVDPKQVGGSATQEVGSNVVTYEKAYWGFWGYVKYYNLEWLVWFAALLGAVVLVRLLCQWCKKLWE